MTGIGMVDFFPAVNLPLKGKDNKEVVRIVSQLVNTAVAPRPYRGRNIIINGNSGFFQAPGQSQVEVGVVDENGCIGFAVDRFANQVPHDSMESHEFEQYFKNTHNGEITVVINKFDSLPVEAISSDSEKAYSRDPVLERAHQFHSVGFSGIFRGQDENSFHAPPAYSSGGISS